VANASKTVTPDGTWTYTGKVALSSGRAKLSADEIRAIGPDNTYNVDLSALSDGDPIPGWTVVVGTFTKTAGPFATIQGGWSLAYLTGSNYDNVKVVGNVANCAERSIVFCRHNPATKSGYLFQARRVSSAQLIASRIPATGVSFDVNFLYGRIANWKWADTPYPYDISVSAYTASGHVEVKGWLNDTLISRVDDPASSFVDHEVGLQDINRTRYNNVRIYLLATGTALVILTPQSVSAWKTITAGLDASDIMKGVDFSDWLEYRITGGTPATWTAVPDDGDISGASGGTAIEIRATLNNAENMEYAAYLNSISVQIDGVWSGAAAPDAPTALATGTPGDTSMPLNWTDAAAGNYVQLYRSETNDSGTAVLSDVVAQGAQALTEYGLTAEKTYFWWAKTVGSDGQLSAFSDGATGTTAAAGTPPVAPTGLSVTGQSATEVGLAWLAAADATSYRVMRGPRESDNRDWGAFVQIATTANLAYADNAANSSPVPTEAESYIYQIVGVDGDGAGQGSNAVLATFQSDARTGLRHDDYLRPLQKAIMTRLESADITYTNDRTDPPTEGVVVPIRDKPKEDDKYPLVTIGDMKVTKDRSTKTRAGAEVQATILVMSDYKGIKEAGQIANQVSSEISSPKLSLVDDGLNVVLSKPLAIEHEEIGNGRTQIFLVRFFFIIYEDPAQLP